MESPSIDRPGRRAATALAAATITWLFAAGCGDDRGERVTTYPVTGHVRLPDGQPLADGAVVFVPAPGSATARQAAGKIESDGRYTLKTPNSGDGAAPGEYKVRVETADTGPAPKPGSRTPSKPKFSAIYLEEDRSGLTYTVKPEPNSYDIQLK